MIRLVTGELSLGQRLPAVGFDQWVGVSEGLHGCIGKLMLQDNETRRFWSCRCSVEGHLFQEPEKYTCNPLGHGRVDNLGCRTTGGKTPIFRTGENMRKHDEKKKKTKHTPDST